MERNNVYKVIQNYFHIKYESMAELKVHEGIREIFLQNNEMVKDYYTIETTALGMAIDKRKLEKNDLKFAKYKFYLEYISLEINNNKATAVINESHDIYFNSSSNTKSQMANLRHNIYLEKFRGKWYIIKDIYDDYYKNYIISCNKKYHSFDKVKEMIEKQNSDNLDEEHQITNNNCIREIALSENKTSKQKLYNYNRVNAVNYARMWALKINPRWGNYEPKVYGGDCTNFTSQCIYAGGIPFDFHGTSELVKWYWYSNNKRVAPWTGAKQFNYYVQYNKGFGLKAHFGALKDMMPGDIVQLGGNFPKTYHSMIISDYVYDANGYVKDYLICQHSTSVAGRLKDYPLSSKPPAEKVYISIDGYYK